MSYINIGSPSSQNSTFETTLSILISYSDSGYNRYPHWTTNQIKTYILASDLFRKIRIKARNSCRETDFSVHNIHFYLCGQVENSKMILCSRKTGVKCVYLKFLMYKYIFIKYEIKYS